MFFKVHSFFKFLLGLVGGTIFTHIIKYTSQFHYDNCIAKRGLENIASDISLEQIEKTKLKKKKFILIGIMTAEKYLDSRAKAVYETWGSDLKGYGKLIFFASSQSKHSNLPVVYLDGVDDSYPPQRKSMMMLKYMHDNYIDEYKWFLRGDDDVYIRIDKLKSFLSGLNSDDDLYIGQSGKYKEILNFKTNENYCLGGPSFLFTASALSKLIPYVRFCLDHLKTKHEDVEVGRCMHNFVGISCTWALEMESLFYHNRAGISALLKMVKTNAVHNAITIHPIKISPYMQILHFHFLELKIREHTQDTVWLQRQLKTLDMVLSKGLNNISLDEMLSLKSLNNFYNQMPKDEEPEWEMFTAQKIHSHVQTTKHEISRSFKVSINDVLRQLMSIINKGGGETLREMLIFKRLNFGYRRYHPKYGVQYILDFLMNYRAPLGLKNQRLDIHDHHQAYLQQPFGNTIYSIDHKNDILKDILNFILPLDGNFSAFVNFMSIYEKICLQRSFDTSLTVVYFSMVTPSAKHVQYFMEFKTKYPRSVLQWIELNESFSRSLGLATGALNCDKNSLLVFSDINMNFNEGFLKRCKTNARKGRQVYYPMAFNQSSSFEKLSLTNSPFHISKDNGFWSVHEFKISCQYRADFDSIGGFNMSIPEEENKDIDLYERLKIYLIRFLIHF